MVYYNKKREIDLLDYWRVILKRKWVLIAFAGSLVLFTGIFSFMETPLYRSTTTVMIEDDTSRMFSIDDTFSSRTPVVRDMRFFNTQLRLLKSKSLAERVVQRMGLLTHPEFDPSQRKKSFQKRLKDLVTLKWLFSKKKSAENGPEQNRIGSPYSSIARAIRNKITANPIRDTKLVDVSFTFTSPRMAADVVNTLAEEFINFSTEKRYENTQQASDFLGEQITSLRADLASKESEMQQYGAEKDLVFLNDQESSAVNTFAELNRAYTDARVERIRAESTYLELQGLDADRLPEFVNNVTIQQLNAEYKRAKSEYEEKSQIYKPDYPSQVQLKARLDSMKDEIGKAVEGVESEFRTALSRERNLLRTLNSQKNDVSQMKSDAILYNSLKIEVENIRSTLSSLIEKQSDALISSRLGGIKSSNISVIDLAEVSRYPISPRKKLNLMIALIFGLCGGIALCFGLEYLDNTIKGPDDIERISRLPSLGIVSHISNEVLKNKDMQSYGEDPSKIEGSIPEISQVELINHLYPKLFIAEDYRTVRTSLLLSHADNPPKTIVFTSSLPSEGKTCTSANMSVSFAQLDKKVLLIDTDLRKPRMHRIFDTKNNKGLSGYLAGKQDLKEVKVLTSIKNIWLIPSGLIPPNPAELLNSKRMGYLLEEVKNDYDIILVDSPPVLAVVDSVITSSLADTTVLVVKSGKTTTKNFAAAYEELKRAKVNIAGVVFNEVKIGKDGYNYMSYYNYSRTDYYETEEG